MCFSINNQSGEHYHDTAEVQDDFINQDAVVHTMKNMLAKQKEKLDLVASKLHQSEDMNRQEREIKPTTTSAEVQPPENYHAILAMSSRFQFPEKLYYMLEIFGSDSDLNTVSWLAHGRAFKIIDEYSFMECIVPMFFKQRQIRSTFA